MKKADLLKFRNWPVFWKISLMPITAIGLIIMGVFFFILPDIKDLGMEEKEAMLSSVVNIAYNMVVEYDKRVASGEFTLEEGQQRAANRLKNFRFGKDGKDYIWVNDMGPKMIMHPINPELNGKDISDIKDPNGRALFIEMVNIVKNRGEGVISYLWPKPGELEPQQKVSYVKGYKPWGWVIVGGSYTDDIAAVVHKMLMILGGMIVVISALVTLITFIVGRGFVTKPMNEFKKALRMIAEGGGDLTKRLEEKSTDEIGGLVREINMLLDSYGMMINNTLASASNVVRNVGALRDDAKVMSEGAKTQYNQAHQISTAAEEMSQTVTDISKSASLALDVSNDALKTADNGKQISDGAVDSVNKVFTSTIDLSAMIEKLNKSVGEIGGIVVVITDIADQTNLLALNAAIEAARAGEQGRGFAVVADEVRKLAEKTIKATSEINEKITAVQHESELTTKSMNTTTEEVTRANEYIKEVGEALAKINESVRRAGDQISQIATAVEQQSASAKEVAKNIEITLSISKETDDKSRRVLKGANNIIGEVDNLRKASSGFKTGGSGIVMLEIARSDHKAFLDNIDDVIKGNKQWTSAKLHDSHNCRFGMWYDTEGTELFGHLATFKTLALPHERIHTLAKDIVNEVNAGDKNTAKSLYNEFEKFTRLMHEGIDAIENEYSASLASNLR